MIRLALAVLVLADLIALPFVARAAWRAWHAPSEHVRAVALDVSAPAGLATRRPPPSTPPSPSPLHARAVSSHHTHQ